MLRNIDMNEISDGKLYTANDLVKADCQDCTGCSACCQGMGESIILDPLDVYRLTGGLKKSFEELLEHELELHVVDGIILPNLKMVGEREACAFLNEAGRCSIHPHRPGMCRLFPLGRFYEDHGFKYFLQIHECKKENRSKVKVKKWIDTPDLKENEQYIIDWHYFLKELQEDERNLEDAERMKLVNMYVLRLFYQRPYRTEEPFYPQFYERLARAKEDLS